MTNSISLHAKTQIQCLETSFAELKTVGKQIFKNRPAYEQWTYSAIDTIATNGAGVMVLGIVLAIGFKAAPLLTAAFAVGMVSVTAMGIKKFMYSNSILHLNLPKEKTGMFTSIDFFNALERRVFIPLNKFSDKYTIARANYPRKIELSLHKLTNYLNDVEKNHPDIKAFDKAKVEKVKDAVREVRLSTILIKAVNCLISKNKTEFAVCLASANNLSTNKAITSLERINNSFEKACQLLTNTSKSSRVCVVDIIEQISNSL